MHVAAGQELVVGLQRVQSLGQRTADRSQVLGLIGAQVVEVAVHGIAGLELVLDAVQAGHEDRGEGQIGVRVGSGKRTSTRLSSARAA